LKINKNNQFKKLYISILFFLLLISINYKKFIPIKIIVDASSKNPNKYAKDNLMFNFINIKLYYSYKYNITKICYNIQVLNSNNNPIIPSDLMKHHNLHILCFININNVNIYSLSSIDEDKYFRCVEFSYFYEDIKIGIIIYETTRNNIIKKKYVKYLDNNNKISHIIEIDNIFDSSKINYEYDYMISQTQNKNSLIQAKKLKKLYISRPFIALKRNMTKKENEWYFLNLYNEYFCFCKGLKCLTMMISGRCKYFFYLYLIDMNSNVYQKTDFLLMDFILKKYSSDDVYPIFEEMIKRKLKAHYMTGKEEIYKKYCNNNKFCDSIIYIEGKRYKINGNFLEKHFSLILKLRQVLSSVGVSINYINNLFYNIDYILYICIGHGVSYFKYYLYKDYYGPKNFDKLLIPNSEKLISVCLKYGWKEENLIKLNLPKWEKYNKLYESSNKKGNIKSNSIFIMFTWRELRKGRKISSHYINNILGLINNEKLINNLLNHNLTLYFALHHNVLKYKKKFKMNNSIKYIEENDIFECLSKTNLLVTDFSSIIFDIIYRRKPYIIFIPDSNDPIIKTNYLERCYEIIKNFENNEFAFENIYFDLNSTIDKVNYYINNQFQLDTKLESFYDDFNFKSETIINDFINYILKL
jgi:hypothetical protein